MLIYLQTGQIKTLDDVPQRLKDFGFPRFQPGNFEHNLKLVDEVEALAKKKGVSMAQISLAWMLTKPDVSAPIIGTTSLSNLEDILGESPSFG